jgi:MGT family glycosyltransferase
MSTQAPTVAFFPEGAYGPTNNCVGMGELLHEQGMRVVFIVEESFAGSLEARGFEERIVRLTPPPEQPEAPGQFWKDFIRETGPVFRRPTIEQLEGYIEPAWRALADTARYVEPQLLEVFDEVRPDVIVEDNVPCFPAIVTNGKPWVRVISCNPLELRDPALPPVFSGYPVADRTGWEEFREEYRRLHEPLHAEFDEFCRENGTPPLPPLEFIHESPYLNLYLYPEEADYRRDNPLGPRWHRIDSNARVGDGTYEIPEHLSRDVPLLYLSLGSLGSADVELMQRLIDLLADGPYSVIVSKGPQGDQLTLADNMAGAEFLPQPAILPHVDLVITHCGNNTTTECFHHGKPMVALPLFWDQYDNAQRVHETGHGIRLDTFGFEDSELTGAIDRLLADRSLADLLETTSGRIKARDGRAKAARLIGELARA